MREGELRRQLALVSRDPEDVQAWGALGDMVERVRARLPIAELRPLAPHLMEALRVSPSRRSLTRLLEPVLGLWVDRGGQRGRARPGRFWLRSSRLREAEDHLYDALTGLPLQFIRPTDGALMVLVPALEAPIGSHRTPSNPRRLVHMPAFLIDRFPVTRGQLEGWERAGNVPPSGGPRAELRTGGAADRRRPAVWLDFWEARSYARYARARLPHEDQWELACRGNRGALYPWGDDSPNPRRANFDGYDLRRLSRHTPRALRTPRDWRRFLLPVGHFPRGASPFGAEETVGTVREWCRHDALDPALRLSDPRPRMRGSSWLHRLTEVDPALRSYQPDDPSTRALDLGLRLVRNLPALPGAVAA